MSHRDLGEMLMEGRDTDFADLVCFSREKRAQRRVSAKMVPCGSGAGRGERWKKKQPAQRRDLE